MNKNITEGKKYSDILRYGLLALLLFLPLLKPGYIQSFDMPWGPIVQQTSSINNYWFIFRLLEIFSYVLSSMIVQKLLLISIFILAGVGAHRLIKCNKAMSQGVAYVAGIFYMFNPFIYTRLMAGQWLVLLGYALLPWALVSLWKLMRQPGLKTAIIATAWTAAVGLTSIHAVGFVILAALVLCIAAGKDNIRQRLKWCAATAAAWAVVNAIWLIPLLLGKSANAMQITGFGSSQMHAFASTGSVLGSVPLSTLLLQGFWADPQGRYYLPSHLGWWWGIVVVLLGALIVFGAATAIRQRDRLGISLGILAIIAWWLGMGVGCSWSAGTANFLAAHVPLYRGYREPQKWLMLLALAYAYFVAIGAGQVTTLVAKYKPSLQQTVLYTAALLPILSTPMLLWGAGGQLVSAEYPKAWSHTKQILDADTSDYKVLVLPWHLYLPLSFAKRVVANPASHYFTQNMVVSDNLELAGVPPQQSTALYRQIDNVLLPLAPYRTNAATQLAPYHVKYVILMKEADWQQYGWLSKQTDLKRVQKSSSIDLYRNTEVR